MTQKTKLEIIGPYTPDHDGPFCTREGQSVRILCRDLTNDYSIAAAIADGNGRETVYMFTHKGQFSKSGHFLNKDLMNAREVPVAREFWVNSYPNGDTLLFEHPEAARDDASRSDVIRTIHVREVLPGEGV